MCHPSFASEYEGKSTLTLKPAKVLALKVWFYFYVSVIYLYKYAYNTFLYVAFLICKFSPFLSIILFF